jgi:UDP-4-amino-4,6-dideoxy-N-acetyl-beta-L-altrosamine transaminase
MKAIPYSRQEISKEDIASVVRVLKSKYITQGPEVKIFEKKIAQYLKVKYSVAVNSATSALHIACLSLGLKKNDIVWTTPNTFVASSNCALMCGAKIDFVDIDGDSLNICLKNLEKKLIYAKKINKLPKILIIVHYAGNPCELKSINFLKKKYKFKIIEDASHALGAIYDKKKIGYGKFTDIAVFSFHPVKMITTGEGGIAVTNKLSYYELLKVYRDHGIKRGINKKKKWMFDQKFLGFNYRLTDIQSALGTSQLKKIDNWVVKRNKIALRYKKKLSGLPINFQKIEKKNISSFHLFVIIVDPNRTKVSRNEIFNKLIKNRIMVNIHYIPIYRHSYYANMGFDKKKFPNCEFFFKNTISIPIFPSLKNIDQDRVIDIIKSSFKN